MYEIAVNANIISTTQLNLKQCLWNNHSAAKTTINLTKSVKILKNLPNIYEVARAYFLISK